MPDLFEQTGNLWDAEVRIEGMWPVPQVGAPGQLLEVFEMQEALPAGMEAFAASWKDDERAALFDGEGTEARDAWDELFSNMALKRAAGFVLSVATPVMRPTGTGKGAYFSWGHYHTGLIFARSADEALVAAKAWGEARCAADMAKAA